jgi:hypothetical protein
MKRLDIKFKNELKVLATEVQNNLTFKIIDKRIIPIKKLHYEPTDTCGWFVDVFRLKNISGRISIWIDLFPNIDVPIVSICYRCSDDKRIEELAKYLPHAFNYEHPSQIGKPKNGYVLLEKPLAKKYFGPFLIELYEWKFLTAYFFDAIDKGISKSLKKKVSNKIELLMRRIVSVLEVKANTFQDYPAIENRKIVSLHSRRERSTQLANSAKLRDGFNCRVCDFNFADTYGELGREFAEAHHIIALSKLRQNVKTKVSDLITVCSNCHRMLHRMDGQANDFKKLRIKLRK